MYWIIIFLIFSGCDVSYQNMVEPEPYVHLDVWMDIPKEDGEFIFDFPIGSESSYAHIKYQTEPMERVFWYSPDYYTMIYWGREYNYPIVVNSTYSDGETGIGTQLCYISKYHIGDTLDIIGCGTDMCDTTRFIVK
jgi:hypothetical protein|tara:strand:- start:177 stop:584 length:408 start_codon:yes stop_codon:yes gene_type:complete